MVMKELVWEHLLPPKRTQPFQRLKAPQSCPSPASFPSTEVASPLPSHKHGILTWAGVGGRAGEPVPSSGCTVATVAVGVKMS